MTYLVHFPDGERTVRTHLIGLSPPGTVGVHDPWLVTRVERLDSIVEGRRISFEVWVKGAPSQVVVHASGTRGMGANHADESESRPALRLTFLLHGVRVTRWDAWWVVGRLRCVGRADETTAAWVIDRALTDRAQAVTLSTAECEAVLDALGDAPDGLRELREELERARHDQSPR